MLKERFNSEIKDTLMKDLGLKNKMSVPTLEKVVVNVGVKDALVDSKVLDEVEKDLATITGQKPTRRLSKKAIAGFKLREGQAIGVAVTLRGEKMWSFLERLLTTALPRVRDFRGLPDSFDGQGNYSLGLREQIVFPEIDYSKVGKLRGLQVTIKTTAKETDSARKLLKALGLPIKGDNRG
ncbi:MAG TPA: 50S ribosomal protein L5 [Patescibacteria group bacterium]|nr:50S ribosomal protein L5 [Patescibacteria group bacterium]